MKSKIILSTILIFSLLISAANAQYLYLLENDMSSDKWITNSPSCIFNQTLGVWQLNGTGAAPEYEDFTEYSEVSGGSFSQNETASIWTNYDRTTAGNVYKNPSTEYGSAFTVYFKLLVTDIQANTGGTIMIHPLIFSNAIANDWRYIQNGNYESYGLRITSDLSQGSVYDLIIVETENGDTYTTTVMVDLDVGTDYYIKFEKSGSLIEASIYSDKGFSNLLDDGSQTMQSANNGLQVISAPIGHNALNGPRTSSGLIQFMTFNEPVGGYEPSGSLYSEDLLTNTTMGPAWIFCTDQTVPDGTSLTVEFSEDNITWVRPIELSTTVGALKESVYLGDLNYSSLYVRYNLTSSGADTPEITYMALAYIIETPESGNGWIISLVAGPLAFIIGLAAKLRRVV